MRGHIKVLSFIKDGRWFRFAILQKRNFFLQFKRPVLLNRWISSRHKSHFRTFLSFLITLNRTIFAVQILDLIWELGLWYGLQIWLESLSIALKWSVNSCLWQILQRKRILPGRQRAEYQTWVKLCSHSLSVSPLCFKSNERWWDDLVNIVSHVPPWRRPWRQGYESSPRLPQRFPMSS